MPSPWLALGSDPVHSWEVRDGRPPMPRWVAMTSPYVDRSLQNILLPRLSPKNGVTAFRSLPPDRKMSAAKPAEKSAGSDFLVNFLAGGISGAVAKTLTAPIERVKLIIQTQDSNPKIRSGEVARYTGIGNCFTRIAAEQGVPAFWRGNLTNIIRYCTLQW